MTMAIDGQLQTDSVLRSQVVADASVLALKGSRTVIAGQEAWGRHGRATTDVVLTGTSTPMTLGILATRQADVQGAVTEFISVNKISIDEPSQARIRSAVSALDVATRPGCLGAILR
jgi:hypothetical protein